MPVNVPELPLILVGADDLLAVVMALMYAVVGLYRPAPISYAFSAAGRTLFALVVGGLHYQPEPAHAWLTAATSSSCCPPPLPIW